MFFVLYICSEKSHQSISQKVLKDSYKANNMENNLANYYCNNFVCFYIQYGNSLESSLIYRRATQM